MWQDVEVVVAATTMLLPALDPASGCAVQLEVSTFAPSLKI
jgi:hypothetical protein